MKNYSSKSYYSRMFFIAYTFEGQVHVFAGRVKIVIVYQNQTRTCQLVQINKNIEHKILIFSLSISLNMVLVLKRTVSFRWYF